MGEVIAAAKAVCDRWDSPDWSDGTHTKEYIDRLRKALAHEQEAEPIGWTPEMDLIRIGDFKRTIVLYGMYRKHTIPLYTHPAPMRKLTEDVA